MALPNPLSSTSSTTAWPLAQASTHVSRCPRERERDVQGRSSRTIFLVAFVWLGLRDWLGCRKRLTGAAGFQHVVLLLATDLILSQAFRILRTYPQDSQANNGG